MAILFLLFLVSGPRGLEMWVGANSLGALQEESATSFATSATADEEVICQSGNVTSVFDDGGPGHNASTIVINCTDITLGIAGDKVKVASNSSVSSSVSSRSSRGDRYGNGRMDKEDYELFMSIIEPVRFSLHVGVLPILALAVVSFSREKVISDSTCYMITINALEFFCSFFNAVLYVMKYGLENATTHQVYIVWVLLSNYGIVCGRRTVYLLTTVLCVQRFIAVTSPMKSRQMTSPTIRNTVLTSTILGTFSVHVYLALMYDVRHMGGEVYIMTKSTMYADNILLFDIFGYFTKTAFSYVPLLSSLLVNIVLIFFMKRHNEQVKNMRSSKDEAAKSRQERQMTWMILVSTLAFTILSIPSNVNYMISTIDDVYGTRKQDHYLYSFVKGIVNALQTVADLINFLCYVTLSYSFRQKVKTTLMCQSADMARKLSSSTAKKSSGSGFKTETKSTMSSTNGGSYEVNSDPSA